MRGREGAKEGVGVVVIVIVAVVIVVEVVVAAGADAYVLPALAMLEEEGNGGNQV